MGGPSNNNSGGNTGADEGFFLTDREKKRKQKEEAEKSFRENRGDGNRKYEEQPKVESQMDNTEIKSDDIVADKEINKPKEMTADEIILKNKKKGRKSTVLTSVTGVEGYPTLSKKSLLGG